MNFLAIKDNPQHPLYWTYHRLRNYWPIWYYWLNGAARRYWKDNRPTLDAAQKRMIEDLNRDGIALAPITDFFNAEVFSVLKKTADKLFNEPGIKQEIKDRRAAILNYESLGIHKEFFVYAMGGGAKDRPVLDLGNPFFHFVFNDKIIAVAAEYLRLAPRFNSFALLQTLMIPASRKRTESQRWHRDLDDKKMLKVFIYLNDVDEGGGPFTYVKGSQLGGRFRGVAPQLPPMGRYPKDGEVEAAVPEKYHHLATGFAGTIIFADTSGLHRGGFCLNKDRFHFVGGFTSWASVLPVSYTFKQDPDMEHLSPLAKYSLS